MHLLFLHAAAACCKLCAVLMRESNFCLSCLSCMQFSMQPLLMLLLYLNDMSKHQVLSCHVGTLPSHTSAVFSSGYNLLAAGG